MTPFIRQRPLVRAIQLALRNLCKPVKNVTSEEKPDVMCKVPQSAAVPPKASASATSGTSQAAVPQMKRVLDAIIHGIPNLFYVDCSSCLFWRGVLVGAVVVEGAWLGVNAF